MAIDLAALKKELDADPRYSPWLDAGDDSAVAAELNRKDDSIQIVHEFLTPAEIQNALDFDEYDALNAGAQALLLEIMKPPTGETPKNRNLLAGMFRSSPKTRANLEALFTRAGSKAEELFGAGAVVSHEHVGKVLAPERQAVLAEREALEAPALAAQMRSNAEAVLADPEADARAKERAAKDLMRAENLVAYREAEAARVRAKADEHTSKLDAILAEREGGK
jgi:hypothetical protein